VVISEYLVLDYSSLQLEDINSRSFLIDSAELGKTKFKNHGKKDNGQQKKVCVVQYEGRQKQKEKGKGMDQGMVVYMEAVVVSFERRWRCVAFGRSG
jgi:hypothetical protein